MKTCLALLSISLLLILISACKPAQQKEKTQHPNILFCIADDVTFKHMGAYGCKWVKTPAFDRIASEGILFQNAYTPNAKCAPSRSCIITGRNSWQLEEAGNHWSFFPVKFKSVVETLGQHGYFTGFTAKGIAPVVAKNGDGSPRTLLGKRYSEAKLIPPTKAISNIDYAENFRLFLEDRPVDQPFFFWYGGIEPHRRYEYGSGMRVGNKQLSDVDEVFSFWPENDSVRNDLLDYALEIEHFDQHLDRMVRELETRGILENTLIIVTADNGMPFPRIKGQAYEYSNHLPLAMMWKNGIEKPGRIVKELVSFIDFAPTFLDLAAVDESNSGMKPIQGESLVEYFNSTETDMKSEYFVLIGKERHDVGRPQDQGYPIRGIRSGEFLFIRNFETKRWPSGNPETGYLNCDGGATKSNILNERRRKGMTQSWLQNFGKRPERELYNVVKDPDCVHNLIKKDEFADLAKQLEDRMLQELKEQQDPRLFGKESIFDNYKYANKRDVDFYNRFMRGEEVKAGWVNLSDFEPKKEMVRIMNSKAGN